jgi:hypothetical protein
MPAVRKWREQSRIGAAVLSLLALSPICIGCAAGGASFVRPDVDFSRIQRCAVLPFQNLTSDGYAEKRLQSIFLTELLSRGALVLVDPEETVSAMKELRLTLGSMPNPEQVIALGKALSVEGVFFGSVEEYGLTGRSRGQINHVTATFSMAETETGNLIWRAQVHVDGSSFWKRLFGGDSASLYDVSRKAVRKAMGTLL